MVDGGIATRQNEKHALNLLAAQRYLYSHAKWLRIGESFGTVLLAAASPFIVWQFPEWSQWLAAAAGAWLLLVRVLFAPLRKGAVSRAALVQESFDSYVFGLSWNDALGRQPSREDVIAWARKLKWGKGSRLMDWYEPTEGSESEQVIACQRMSVVWSRRQNQRYFKLLTAVTVAWSAIIVVVALVLDLSLAETLVALVLPSMPAVLAGVEHAGAHRDASGRAQDIESAIGRALASNPERDVARDLQDEVYHWRREAPLVPDWFYKMHRDKDQDSMEYGADEYRGST